MPDTSTNLFASHSSIVDTWSKEVLLQIDKSLNPPRWVANLGIVFNDIKLEATCTVTVAAASFVDMQDTSKISDAYLIALDLALKPSKWTRHYRVTVRALSDESVPTQGPDDVTALVKNANSKWTDDIWSVDAIQTFNRKTRVDSRWLSTSPETVGDSESISTSTSFSLGGSIGFFGKIITGGADFSYSFSYSKTVHIAPVKVTNCSGIHALDIRFRLQNDEGAKSTFQPHISGLLITNDDGQGVRNDDPAVANARHLCLELCIWALPDGFYGPTYLEGCGLSQIPHMIRTFKVRVPPKPPSVVT